MLRRETLFGSARTKAAWLVVVALCVAGCSAASVESYIPEEVAARDSLNAALTAWQSGQPVGTVAGAAPAIQVEDSVWKSGKSLTQFEILEELPRDGSPDSPRRFKVKLKLNSAAQFEETVYYVVGKDPLWVFREADYKRATGM